MYITRRMAVIGAIPLLTGLSCPPPPAPPPVSADGSTLVAGVAGTLVTADGKWTFGTTKASGGSSILLNGQATSGFAEVLVVEQAKMFALTLQSTWWMWHSGWSQTTDPTGGSVVLPNQPAPAPPPPSPGSYQSSFLLTENPISDGGRWHNNGLDWNNVQTANGKAFGTILVPSGYSDSYAWIDGFGADHTVEATIFKDESASYTDSHEIAVHLRKTDGPNFSTGYEIGFPYQGRPGPVRWNGAVGDFTFVNTTGPGYDQPMKTGDAIKASIAGSTISIFVNGILVSQAVDSTFRTGAPATGFFARADTYAQYCMTHVKVSSP
jgi:hypothetical protein